MAFGGGIRVLWTLFLVHQYLPFGYFRALNRYHIFSIIYLVTDEGLTLKAPITTTAENNFTFIYYFIYIIFILFNFFREKSLDISDESSVKQMIHTKYQDLFLSK